MSKRLPCRDLPAVDGEDELGEIDARPLELHLGDRQAEQLLEGDQLTAGAAGAHGREGDALDRAAAAGAVAAKLAVAAEITGGLPGWTTR